MSLNFISPVFERFIEPLLSIPSWWPPSSGDCIEN